MLDSNSSHPDLKPGCFAFVLHVAILPKAIVFWHHLRPDRRFSQIWYRDEQYCGGPRNSHHEFGIPFPVYACFDSCRRRGHLIRRDVQTDVRFVIRPCHRILRGLPSAELTPHKNPRRALLRWGAERRRTSTESCSDCEPTPFRGAPSSCTSSSWYFSVTRTMVRGPRVRRGPAPDPIPLVFDRWPSASTSHSWLMACWWIPPGGKVRLCSHFRLLSFLALTVCAFQNRVSRLRSGAHVPWPRWWTPVGVANHEKSFCLYFHRILSLGSAVRVKLLFPLHGVVRRSGSNSQGCVWFGFPWFLVSTCFPSGCLVWLCSRLFLGHRKSHPKSRTAPSWLERSQDWK